MSTDIEKQIVRHIEDMNMGIVELAHIYSNPSYKGKIRSSLYSTLVALVDKSELAYELIEDLGKE